MAIGFEDVSTPQKLLTCYGLAGETLNYDYMAIQFYGSNHCIRLPQNPTAEVHGIAQHAANLGREVLVVMYGLTKFRSNGTVNFWEPLINNQSSGELTPNPLHANESKGDSVVLGRCFKAVTGTGAQKIGIILFNPDNGT